MRLRSRRTFFLLILIGLLTAGCYGRERGEDDAGGDGDVDADVDGDVDADSDSDVDADADVELCDPYEYENVFEVETAPEGIPATADAICVTSVDPAVANRAARVTLEVDSDETLHLARGHVAVPPALFEDVVGLPTLTVDDASPAELVNMTVSGLTRTAAGFDFSASWPEPMQVNLYDTRMTIRTSLEVRCDPSGSVTRTVDSTTYLNLCDDVAHKVWRSSGDTCTVCEVVCEMAPSPIVPAGDEGPMALSRALRARIVPVARTGRSLCLLVEHQGTRGGVTYDWRVSSGRISEPDLGGVVWDLPKDAGPHLAQVAVRDRDSAAVATLIVRHGA